MTLILGILTFFLVLAILVLVHEAGHFSFAKIFGVRVEEFGIGFPPRVRTWRRGGTIYSLNAIPLGGFVRMLGENGEAREADSFGAKPPWQRFIILVGGPSMNILLALLIFFFVFLTGVPNGLTSITGVSPHSPAARAGLRVGDRILALDGQRTTYRSDLQTAITQAVTERPGRPVALRVKRGASVYTVHLVPRVNPPRDQGALGVVLAGETTVSYSPGTAVVRSVQSLGLMVAVVPQILTSVPEHGAKDIAGPIGIAQQTTETVGMAPHYGPSPLLYLIAFLSANLGVLNLLPIPALDGGRVVFVLISWIRGRNLDPELEGLIHMVGMALLLALIAFISYQDLARWISGGSS